MTPEQIIENNKLIAEFMECYKEKPGIENNKLIAEFMECYKEKPGDILNATNYDKFHTQHDRYPIPDYEMKFHSSWDWLMPVWNKIMKWGKNEYGIYWEQHIDDSSINIKTKRTNIISMWPVLSNQVIEIMDVYRIVIDFIQWYNNQKGKDTV